MRGALINLLVVGMIVLLLPLSGRVEEEEESSLGLTMGEVRELLRTWLDRREVDQGVKQKAWEALSHWASQEPCGAQAWPKGYPDPEMTEARVRELVRRLANPSGDDGKFTREDIESLQKWVRWEPRAHSSSCPGSCVSCDQTVGRALAYISGSQHPDGYWEVLIDGTGGGYRGDGRPNWATCAVSGLNGLALLGSGSTAKEGSYREEIRKTRDWLLVWFGTELDDAIMKEQEIVPFMLSEGVVFGGYFLMELYGQDRSPAVAECMERLYRWLRTHQKPCGAWGYLKWGGMTRLANVIVPWLLMYKSLGFEVEPQLFDRICGFYAEYQNEDGGYPYHGGNCWPGTEHVHEKNHLPSDHGRTIGALWAMRLLGMEKKTDVYQRGLGYLHKHYTDVAGSHHGSSLQLALAGLSILEVDAALWQDYWTHHRDDIIFSQAQDGSILMEPPRETYGPVDGQYGPMYTTPWYVILMQAPWKRLALQRLEPLAK
jgi:hypothetical protein